MNIGSFTYLVGDNLDDSSVYEWNVSTDHDISLNSLNRLKRCKLDSIVVKFRREDCNGYYKLTLRSPIELDDDYIQEC